MFNRPSFHSITSPIFTLSLPYLHLSTTPSPAFSWRWLSHATKRSTRRSKSRRDSRRPRREQDIENVSKCKCESYGNIMEISWKYHGNIMEISWKYHGNIMEISWKYHGNIMEISWKYHGNILNHVVTAHFLLSLWLKKKVVWSKQLQKPITCLHTGRRSFLSRPSLANKRLDSCTVMSWRHSSGTYHQTWQDLTRLECPVGRCPVGRLGIVLNQTRARCCREDPKRRCDIFWSQEFPRPKVSEGKHAKLRKMPTNSSKQYNLLWCSKLERAESHSLSCPNPGLPG